MSPYALPSGEGKATWFLNTLVVEKAGAEQTGGTFSLTEQTLPPGFETPYHVHHAEDEAFYVVTGEVEFVGEAGTVKLGPGGYFYGPRNVPHGFRVAGEQTAKLLVWATPPGYEQFVVEYGEPAASATLPPPTAPDFARLAALGKKYRFDILGPLPR